ncbi:MAG TPA: hypothetical protein PKE27_08595 [Povalibacter sp.]|uniref:hypothetical protein n=1 Tax=Povalibacter sp. TaxID=1962978 RepID=UPI002CCC0EE6|nr:hypothetical protein [Povalibacter sp.]HMN44616.1 hypothetical protein [Povalibacter sp.]
MSCSSEPCTETFTAEERLALLRKLLAERRVPYAEEWLRREQTYGRERRTLELAAFLNGIWECAMLRVDDPSWIERRLADGSFWQLEFVASLSKDEAQALLTRVQQSNIDRRDLMAMMKVAQAMLLQYVSTLLDGGTSVSYFGWLPVGIHVVDRLESGDFGPPQPVNGLYDNWASFDPEANGAPQDQGGA